MVSRLSCWNSRGEGPAVPDNIVLIMRFHPVSGEDISVICADFGGESEALEAIARALDERRSLVLIHARYAREPDENGVVINLANVVSVRVTKTDSAATGQYL
jgi:histidinol phosphatase-like PHP family hydrolase